MRPVTKYPQATDQGQPRIHITAAECYWVNYTSTSNHSNKVQKEKTSNLPRIKILTNEEDIRPCQTKIRRSNMFAMDHVVNRNMFGSFSCKQSKINHGFPEICFVRLVYGPTLLYTQAIKANPCHFFVYPNFEKQFLTIRFKTCYFYGNLEPLGY